PTAATTSAAKIAETLRLVHRAALAGDGAVGFAGDGIISADVNANGVSAGGGRSATAPTTPVHEDALGLPGLKLGELFRKCLRITGDLKCFRSKDGGSRVLAMLAARGLGGEAGDDDIRAERSHDANDVADHGLMVPGAQR